MMAGLGDTLSDAIPNPGQPFKTTNAGMHR